MNILAIVPTYNEENKISSTVSALNSLPGVSKVVVVDDNSQDNTLKNTKKTMAQIIAHKKNLGKGMSLNKAINELDLNGVDGVILADGDLGESAKEFAHLINVFEDGSDMLIAGLGSPSRKGGFGIVKGLSRWAINKYGGREMQSPISGQRLLTKKTLKQLIPFAKGFGLEVDMTIRALRAGLKVEEVQTNMSHDETGRDLAGFMHRGKQFLDIFKVVIKHALGRKK